MTHRHSAISTTTAPFTGTAAGSRENRRAHGNIAHVERCACGATRTTNANAGASERGTWQAQRPAIGPRLVNYRTGEVVRAATAREVEASREAKVDGGHGLIEVCWTTCYVEE